MTRTLEQYRVPVWERNTLPYETNGEFGVALEVGEYELLATENGGAQHTRLSNIRFQLTKVEQPPDDAVISLAVWRPDVPPGVRSPVIAEFGPYFQEASVETPTIEVPAGELAESDDYPTNFSPTDMRFTKSRFQVPAVPTIAYGFDGQCGTTR